MEKYAVIVAGGSGQRMGTEIPKQFLLLRGKPLLQYTIQSFLLAFADVHIILVLPQAHLQSGQQIAEQIRALNPIRIISGGATRFHSVQNGLKQVSSPSVVFVHDGVRCMVSVDLITRCYAQTLAKGSAIPVVAATDSVRIDEADKHYTVDRTKIKIVQTPQTFLSELVTKAFEQEYRPSFTDEATVVEAAGNKVFLIEGDYNNLKVTRPIDLSIAEKLLEGFTS